jgi:hypothetical protein
VVVTAVVVGSGLVFRDLNFVVGFHWFGFVVIVTRVVVLVVLVVVVFH